MLRKLFFAIAITLTTAVSVFGFAVPSQAASSAPSSRASGSAAMTKAASSTSGGNALSVVCDGQSSTLCFSIDFVYGALTYAKPYKPYWRDETLIVGQQTVCNAANLVLGGTSGACPFKDGSGFNNKYQGDQIISIGSNYLVLDGRSYGIVQSANWTGSEWILVPAGGGYYYLVSVLQTDDAGTPMFACVTSEYNPVLIESTFNGAGKCEWNAPGYVKS